MSLQMIVEAYAREALNQATIQPAGDGQFVGRVPALPGVIAFGDTDSACAAELSSVIEDWAWLRHQRGQYIPVIGDVDLNSSDAAQIIDR